MDAHIIFEVTSVLNDNTCAPSIDALRTTHGDNNFIIFYYYLKLNPSERRKSYLSRNAIKNFRSFPYLDFELSFPQVRKTDSFAILDNRRFKNKTAVKIVIKYIFKSRN